MKRPTCPTCPMNVDGKCHKAPPVIDFTHDNIDNPYARRTMQPMVGKQDFCASHPQWMEYLKSLEEPLRVVPE